MSTTTEGLFIGQGESSQSILQQLADYEEKMSTNMWSLRYVNRIDSIETGQGKDFDEQAGIVSMKI